jgi:glycosyltransferase involved in cell wall biosynthesis
MTLPQKKIDIACNDYHVNLPQNKKNIIPQGGPSRFAQLFESDEGAQATYGNVTSILFSHDDNAKTPYLRIVKKNKHSYYEVVYDAQQLRFTYTRKYTKKEYVTFLDPWINQVILIFKETLPSVLFLNGFSLSNWIIMEAAYRMDIPVYIQHAGIWKKEIMISQKFFSSSIRRIFASLEKETINKTKGQIFLNQFSKRAFLSMHDHVPSKNLLKKMVIIPLPVAEQETSPFKKVIGEIPVIGMVARWDAIKNHSAFMRLAKYSNKKNTPIKLSCVTQAPTKGASLFFENYAELVTIVPPMAPDGLKYFYRSCDVLLVPSRFDVSPTVVIEALSQGIPVIISENTGWVDVFKQFGLSSMIISPRASGAHILEKIQDLTSHYKKYRPHYCELRDYLLKEHKPRRVFASYSDLFKSTVI